MKPQVYWLVLLVVALFAIGAAKDSKYKKWEYQTQCRHPADKAGLDKLGGDGWELVAVTSGQLCNEPKFNIFYFKRPQ